MQWSLSGGFPTAPDGRLAGCFETHKEKIYAVTENSSLMETEDISSSNSNSKKTGNLRLINDQPLQMTVEL